MDMVLNSLKKRLLALSGKRSLLRTELKHLKGKLKDKSSPKRKRTMTIYYFKRAVYEIFDFVEKRLKFFLLSFKVGESLLIKDAK